MIGTTSRKDVLNDMEMLNVSLNKTFPSFLSSETETACDWNDQLQGRPQ